MTEEAGSVVTDGRRFGRIARRTVSEISWMISDRTINRFLYAGIGVVTTIGIGPASEQAAENIFLADASKGGAGANNSP